MKPEDDVSIVDNLAIDGYIVSGSGRSIVILQSCGGMLGDPLCDNRMKGLGPPHERLPAVTHLLEGGVEPAERRLLVLVQFGRILNLEVVPLMRRKSGERKMEVVFLVEGLGTV